MDARELAPQLLLVGELGVQEGHDGLQAWTGGADRADRLVRVGVVVGVDVQVVVALGEAAVDPQ